MFVVSCFYNDFWTRLGLDSEAEYQHADVSMVLQLLLDQGAKHVVFPRVLSREREDQETAASQPQVYRETAEGPLRSPPSVPFRRPLGERFSVCFSFIFEDSEFIDLGLPFEPLQLPIVRES